MRIAIPIAGLLLSVLIDTSVAATPPDGVEILSAEQVAENVAALEAAYKDMARSRVEVTDQVVVLQRKRGFIVVSFIEPCSLDRRCHGGRMHVVYDPATRKVVYVLGEQ
jgi:hypothetical protein